MRTLAIDFGERRIGLAISDEAGRLAIPLATLQRSGDRQAVRAIAEVAAREGAAAVVVGEPVNLDGSRGAAAARVASFAHKLATATGLPVRLVSETLTTVEARQRLRLAGVSLRRHPERLDAVAAQVLLEQALQESPTRPGPTADQQLPEEP